MVTPTIHERSLNTSTLLSQYWKEDLITPDDVISVLNAAKVSFVLVGAYGLAGWLQEPRATKDVDVIVAAKHHKKAVLALLQAYPSLRDRDLDVVTRLYELETGKVVIDVMKPAQQPMREVFKNVKSVVVKGQHYRVPSLEMALVMKFAAITRPNRLEKDKYQDAHDFILVVKANPNLREAKLSELADLVYRTGGRTVLEFVRRVRAGENLIL